MLSCFCAGGQAVVRLGLSGALPLVPSQHEPYHRARRDAADGCHTEGLAGAGGVRARVSGFTPFWVDKCMDVPIKAAQLLFDVCVCVCV